MSWEEKFKLVRETEERLSKTSKQVESSSCQYSEVFEEKVIITTDGADSHMKLVRPSFVWRLLQLTEQSARGAMNPPAPQAVGLSF